MQWNWFLPYSIDIISLFPFVMWVSYALFFKGPPTTLVAWGLHVAHHIFAFRNASLRHFVENHLVSKHFMHTIQNNQMLNQSSLQFR